MPAYYYIIASLPELVFQGKLPLSHPDFETLCAQWLDDGDLRQLNLGRADVENIALEDVSNDLLRRWSAFESTLRNEIAKTSKVISSRWSLPNG